MPCTVTHPYACVRFPFWRGCGGGDVGGHVAVSVWLSSWWPCPGWPVAGAVQPLLVCSLSSCFCCFLSPCPRRASSAVFSLCGLPCGVSLRVAQKPTKGCIAVSGSGHGRKHVVGGGGENEAARTPPAEDGVADGCNVAAFPQSSVFFFLRCLSFFAHVLTHHRRNCCHELHLSSSLVDCLIYLRSVC